MTATNSPSSTSNDTPFRAMVSISSVRKTLRRFSTFSIDMTKCFLRLMNRCRFRYHSDLTESAGFSEAARHERTVTVSTVTASTASNAAAKTHQCIGTR